MATDTLRGTAGRILSHKTSSIVIISIVMQAVCILFVPRYFTDLNIQVLLRAVPELAILSIGVCLLMVAGEFDLSIGSTYALTAFIMNYLTKFGVNAWIALPLTLVVGGLLGAINGVLTIKTRIPSFIVTLGAMMAWRGVVLIITGGFVQNFVPPAAFHFVFAGELGSMLHMQFLWAVVIVAFFWILLENHRLGNAIFATGGNRKAAVEIGINPDAVKFLCFIILGVLVAFCSVLGMTRISSIAPLQGQGLEMVAVAAVVIGGTSLRGGEGDVLGACLGAITIYTIQDALMLMRAPGFYFQLFVGVFIIIAVLVKGFVRAR